MDCCFKLLNAVCRTYEHNMKILHWGACGKKFDRVHKLCDEFEEMFHENVDFAGETGLRIGEEPPSMDEIVKIMNDCDQKFIICDYKLIGYEETIKLIEKMILDVMKILLAIHESDTMDKPENCGIKSEIETVYNKFDFQARYINKHRLMEPEE